MPFAEGADLIEYAIEAEFDDKLFARWLPACQYEMSFEEFKNSLKTKPVKSDEEILSDVDSIINAWAVNNGNIQTDGVDNGRLQCGSGEPQ